MTRKRQTKKEQKKILQERVKSQLQVLNKEIRITEKGVERASYNTLLSLSQKAKSIQRKEQRKSARQRKEQHLKNIGVDLFGLQKKQIDKIKLKDIENRNVTEENYPFIFYRLDFNKKYRLPDNQNLFFGFQDYSGNSTFNEILADFKNRSDHFLLEHLKSLVRKPHTYSKGVEGSSSGMAGTYTFLATEERNILLFNSEVKEENHKPHRRKKHTGRYKGTQVLRSDGSVAIKEVTPHKLLVVANAIMKHVTETDRNDFYNRFYTEMQTAIPAFGKILPEP